MLYRLLVAAALFACLVATPAVHAQPTATPALSAEDARAREEALELFNQGKTAYKAGDYAAALELFRRAQARYDKEPLIILALAKTLDQAGQHEKALGYYEMFLKVAPVTPAFAKDRASTVKRQDEVRTLLAARPGTLQFKGLPTGALLEVNDKPADTDAQGHLQVPAGTHKIRITMEKRLPFERAAVAVGPGETKVIEVVLVAPVDVSTLPRNHTWTWVAGGATAGAVLATGVFVVLRAQEVDDYAKRFDKTGRPLEATLADYPDTDGKPCDAIGRNPPCRALVESEGNERLGAIESQRNRSYLSLGAAALFGLATVAAYYAAPVAEVPHSKPQVSWRVLPWTTPEARGAFLTVGW